MKYKLPIKILTALMIMNPLNMCYADEDDELSIMAAEQRKENDADVTVSEDIETFDKKNEPTAQEKIKPPTTERIETPKENQNINQNINEVEVKPNENVQNNSPITKDNLNNVENFSDSEGMPSPIKTYSNFNDAAKAVGYIPLYVPKKSGYTMNYIAVISGNIVEIRYGRRWEPTVTMAIRTYKRAAGEQIKDISGVYGVKWKVNMSSGMTIYIARVSDNTNVAAWSVGQYTFAAMTENMSFAAFHSFIVEELVDICTHYFIEI